MSYSPSTITAQEIVTAVRGRARLGIRPPNSALQDTELYRVCNSVNEWFVYWGLNNEGVQPLRRFRRQTLIKPKDNTTLNGAISAGATSLILTSGTDFGTPSTTDPLAAAIKNEDGVFQFFTYETRATHVLSGLSTISIDFASGDEVHVLYGLPTDWGQPRALAPNRTQPFIFLDGEFDTFPAPGSYYVKWLLGTTGVLRPFIVLPENISSGITFNHFYVKRPKDIAIANDTFDALSGLEREAVIEKLVAYCWSIRGESALEQEAEAKARNWMEMIHAKDAQFDASPDQGPLIDMPIG